MRRPVIGSWSAASPSPSPMGETGYLVPPRDPEALCDRLEDVLRDPERRLLMGQAGRARVLGSFTWQQVALRTAELYDDLLSNASRCLQPVGRPAAAVARP